MEKNNFCKMSSSSSGDGFSNPNYGSMSEDQQGSYQRHIDYGALKIDTDFAGSNNQDASTTQLSKKCSLLRYLPDWYRREFKAVFTQAWPMALTSVLQFLVMTVAIAFCGQLGVKELAAASLGMTMYGSGDKKGVGILLQRSLIIMTLACIPCWAIHINAEPLLILLGQNPEIARLTEVYMLVFIPGLWFNFLYQVLAKYLQNQNKVKPLLIVGLFGNGVNAISHYVLLMVLKVGYLGSALSQVLAHLSFLLGVIGYILVTGFHKPTWSGWSKAAFFRWGQFVGIAIPGSLMLFLDFFCFEIGMFEAGILGEVELAAQSIMHQIDFVVFMIPLGVSIACSIRVGQCLGMSQAKQAKQSVIVAFSLTFISQAFISIMLLILSPWLPYMFSADSSVIELTSKLIPFIALYSVLDALGQPLNGAMRGCGRQIIGAGTIFVGYYLCGLSTGSALLFLTWLQTKGFWIGMCIGVGMNALLLSLIFVKTDWEKQVEIAQRRVKEATRGEEEQNTEQSDLLEKRRTSVILMGDIIQSEERAQLYDAQLVLSRIVVALILVLLLALCVYIRFEVQTSDTDFRNSTGSDINITTTTVITTTVYEETSQKISYTQ
ncbi:multidrug and toxin extrusion protein 1-like isoform X2 [Tubulanus polymorphus]|uniref:multidrug and toxin extrusion protein 1-like isoform X2 n=1 Tax=Tubulanus polymorphus TaxID=672921 RepID=UPI003DA1D8E0